MISQTTSRRVAGGVAWNYAGSAMVIVAQVFYAALTARMLSPAAFGAYACAQALVGLMAYFSLAALGNALTRMTAMPASTAGTALYLAAAAGTVTALLTVLVANAWAAAWRTPDAAYLIALWVPGILASALGAIPMALLRRRLRYASAAGIESVSALIGFAVGGALVLVLRSPSALVIGQVVGAVTTLGAGMAMVRREISRTFSRIEARGLLSFSGQVSAQNLVHYVVLTWPGLVIARLAGSAALGFLSRANVLVTLPMNFVTVGISKSLYPVIAQMKDVDARRGALSDVVAVGTYLAWPLLGALAGSASVAVDLLFGPGWGTVAAMVPPVCLFAAANLVYVILASATESIGWLKVTWMIQVAWASALALATALAWQLGADARTYLYAYAVTQIVIHIIQVAILSNRGLVPLRSIAAHELVAGSFALLWFAAAFATSQWLDDSQLLVRLAVLGVVLIALSALTLIALPRVAAGKALDRRGLFPKTLASSGP